MSIPYFIGTTVRIIEPHLAMLPPVEAAANLKDPEKIRANIAEKQQRQRENCGNMPFYGQIRDIVILNSQGKMEFQRVLDQQAAVRETIEFLNEAFLKDREMDMTSHIIAYGFNLQDRMRQLATQGALVGTPLNGHLWYHHHMTQSTMVDPFHYILTKELQENLPPWRLLEYIGLPQPSTLHTDAGAQAAYAHKIVKSFGFME